MKEITEVEMEELNKRYSNRAFRLREKRIKNNEPYLDGTASHFYAKLPPAYAYVRAELKDGYDLIFHFKIDPDCSRKPTGFITCCFQKGDKFFIGKHKAGNCPCWKKGYAE